jgi:hypothetical protein
MATRQVASAPEIATALRAVHNINVLVQSVTEADFVISWQLGVLRVKMSGEKSCSQFVAWYKYKSGSHFCRVLLQNSF